MKKYKKIIIISVFILIIAVFILWNYLNSKKGIDENKEEVNKYIEQEYENMKTDSVMYDENSALEELKEEYKVIGESDLYEVQTENDGRKVLNIKPNINYKVAFCGMIKNEKPNFEELDMIFEQNYPNRNGIWIRANDRNKILEYLNNNQFLKSIYKIDKDGYLRVLQENDSTDIDKKIQKLIIENKQYIFNISSNCYMVDSVTGEIVDNPYNELEIYQTYEYFKDKDKIILFITENKDSKLTNDEIFESVINLFDIL